jgi:hypothetical protein
MEPNTCTCGHVLDEHETGFIAPCTIEGCPCRDFELDPDAEIVEGDGSKP